MGQSRRTPHAEPRTISELFARLILPFEPVSFVILEWKTRNE